MPPKDDDNSSTKEVVTKKQKQMLNREELDLSVIAEAFGGFVLEPTDLMELRGAARLIKDPKVLKDLERLYRSNSPKLFVPSKPKPVIIPVKPGPTKPGPKTKPEPEIKPTKPEPKTKPTKPEPKTKPTKPEPEPKRDPKPEPEPEPKAPTIKPPSKAQTGISLPNIFRLPSGQNLGQSAIVIPQSKPQPQPVRIPTRTRTKTKDKPKPDRKPFRFKPPESGTLYLGRRQNPQ